MIAMVINKETNEEVTYSNVLGYDTHQAICNGPEYEPVFILTLTDGTATFHKNEWDLFILKRA